MVLQIFALEILLRLPCAVKRNKATDYQPHRIKLVAHEASIVLPVEVAKTTPLDQIAEVLLLYL